MLVLGLELESNQELILLPVLGKYKLWDRL